MRLSKAIYSAFRLYIFCQYVCSLGIEPTTFCAANAMLYNWATGTDGLVLECHFQQRKIWANIYLLKIYFNVFWIVLTQLIYRELQLQK